MLLQVGWCDLAMLVTDNGCSSLDAAGRGGTVSALDEACMRAGMSQAEIAALKIE